MDLKINYYIRNISSLNTKYYLTFLIIIICFILQHFLPKKIVHSSCCYIVLKSSLYFTYIVSICLKEFSLYTPLIAVCRYFFFFSCPQKRVCLEAIRSIAYLFITALNAFNLFYFIFLNFSRKEKS